MLLLVKERASAGICIDVSGRMWPLREKMGAWRGEGAWLVTPHHQVLFGFYFT